MTSQTMIPGGCLCGAIRYEASAALAFVHFPRGAFRWLGREPRRYRSSRFAERGFCPTCGSPLSMHEEVIADRVQVTVGSLDEPNRMRIDDHVWTKEQLEWFDVADDLPRFPASSTAIATKAPQPGGA